MKLNLFAIFCLAALLLVANATVFEAETSEDVDLFLEDFQDETIGLLFYDSDIDNQDDEAWFARLSTKILGIFMSRDQYGRSTEDWVEMFDDKLHLMRIDVRNPENLRSREEFNIEDAPYIVLKDHRRTVLREKIDDETYEHVRMLLDRRPNLLHKTGGAALKAFNLEAEEGEETAPRVIQYFDLEEGEPTNVEEPIQTQYVNWGPSDVIGPDGQWEQRGRNWITSYEIPESGIKNQEKSSKAHITQHIKDDPRAKKDTIKPSIQVPKQINEHKYDAPKPAPKPAPQPAPKAAPKPAPRPVPVQAPRAPVRRPAPGPVQTRLAPQARPTSTGTRTAQRAPQAVPQRAVGGQRAPVRTAH